MTPLLRRVVLCTHEQPRMALDDRADDCGRDGAPPAEEDEEDQLEDQESALVEALDEVRVF